MEILIYIICKNTLKNIDYDVEKNIIRQIVKNKFSLNNYKKEILYYNIVLQLLLSWYKKYNCIIGKVHLFLWEKIDLNNFTYFTTPIISYIDDIQENIITKYSNINYNNKNNDIINMLLYINLNLFLLIILKNIKIIIPHNYNYQNFESCIYIIKSEK